MTKDFESRAEELGASGELDPWRVVDAIDRLEVGPIRLEPDRLIAPYRVERNGQVDETELVYRYERAVFDPTDAACLNLASMISAQLALNYGLFSRRIVFHGLFDAADRKFLETMAENTAREIYVKKFLEPNPFLVEEATDLPPIRRSRYLRGTLEFADELFRQRDSEWIGDPQRVGILASGGKESLLSLGLLEEMGVGAHSVFLNESGRHWYTALNAHRHLRATRQATTGRVWTTSDRVFSWMLRRLPFIRSDFADVRSDEYPVRLWTVAVFLFGALPELRKRRVGRVVIGDEYDTTVRGNHHGITHYDGVYDQSRYFDDELSRYYRRKKWPLCQFSLLRPLAELVIEKALVRRYPELQEQQVSCHAAHTEGDRVYPCGRCEKCRRIVGMLLALDADPTRCGYNAARVESSLKGLSSKSIHQESAASEHLAYLLKKKGFLQGSATGLGQARERPEIEMLRFHPEKSPPHWIPRDLRTPLVRILLEYSGGVVERQGRTWSPIDPYTSPKFLKPYPFEATADSTATAVPTDSADSAESAESLSHRYLLAELTWPQAKARFEETDTALLPVGAVEQHGPHLPLDVDAWDADHLCRRVAERCTDPKPLVLPLIPYGVSYHHQDFPGTLSISPGTLSRLVYDVGMSAVRHGIIKLVIVNGHGGNAPTLQLAAQTINRDAHIFTCVETGETSDPDIARFVETKGDVHAGEIETSTTLAVRPDLVDMSKAEPYVPSFSSRYLNFSSSHSVDWYAYTTRISPSGVLGDPTRASKEKGEKIWELMIEHLRVFLEALKGMSLEEIYQKRY